MAKTKRQKTGKENDDTYKGQRVIIVFSNQEWLQLDEPISVQFIVEMQVMKILGRNGATYHVPLHNFQYIQTAPIPPAPPETEVEEGTDEGVADNGGDSGE